MHRNEKPLQEGRGGEASERARKRNPLLALAVIVSKRSAFRRVGMGNKKFSSCKVQRVVERLGLLLRSARSSFFVTRKSRWTIRTISRFSLDVRALAVLFEVLSQI